MFPVLVTLPLPRWNLPALPALLALGLLLGLLAYLAWRRRAWDLLAAAGAAAGSCLVGAVVLRGASYRLEPIAVYSYGALLCVSLVAGWHLTLRLGARAGLQRVQVANCYFWTALSGLIGARVLYVLTNWHELEGPLEVLDFRSGGLVAYGGFLGGLAGSLWYARRRGLAWLTWADAAVPSVAAGLALTRLGCYAFGCDFGKPLPAAAPSWLKALGTFPHWPDGTLPHASGAPAWVAHVNGRGLPYDSPASMAVHPTQLYESLLGAALLALLLWAWPRRRFQGELLLLFWLGYGVGRFLLELLRDDPERGAFGPLLSPLALIGVALLAFGGAYALGPARLQRQPRLRLAGLLGWPLGAAALYALLVSNEAAAAQLSTSQWVSVFSALVAGAAWTFVQRLSQAVGARPDSVPAPHP